MDLRRVSGGRGGGGGGKRRGGGAAFSPFFDASGNKIIGATSLIGRKILCLPYKGFFLKLLFKMVGL